MWVVHILSSGFTGLHGACTELARACECTVTLKSGFRRGPDIVYRMISELAQSFRGPYAQLTSATVLLLFSTMRFRW